MSGLSDVGHLRYLYLEDISISHPVNLANDLIQRTAHKLKEYGGRNWVPVIVKEIGSEKYQVIANFFVYQVVLAANLERVWCVIGDSSPETEEISKILAQEQVVTIAIEERIKPELQPTEIAPISASVTPLEIIRADAEEVDTSEVISPQIAQKINLCTASKEEIQAGLEYIVDKHKSSFKGFKLVAALDKITKAPRHQWNDLQPIYGLRCGISKAKINYLEEIFYVDKSKVIPEQTPTKVNLSTASREEIQAGLKYIVANNSSSFPSNFNTMDAVNKISNAPRDKWVDFKPITKLSCGIGTAKLNCLEEIFYIQKE